MKIDNRHVNVGQVLHGGLIASLVDSVSTAALFNTPIRKTGVSVNLNISYIRAAKVSQTILIDSKVNNYGSKLAFLDIQLYLKSNENEQVENYEEWIKTQKLIATGTHAKFIMDNQQK